MALGMRSDRATRSEVLSPTEIGRHIGVDGCRAGWLAVALGPAGGFHLGCYPSISDLWRQGQDAAQILIDIPIGLVSAGSAERTVDSMARRLLRPRRHASVFSPPCREALRAKNYTEACRINQAICGRKLSIQTWHIMPKIKEVDDFLQTTPGAGGILRETHPEICFWSFAGGRPMRHAKKTPDGIKERLSLLQRIEGRTGTIYQIGLEQFARQQVARDDILDALANAVTAVRLKTTGTTLPESPLRDRRGLAMEMVYARPPFH